MALPSVFISYAHEDRSLAEVIAAGLSHRCTVWIDEGELRAGDSVIDRVAEGVEQTDFLVGLVSGASVDSDWCRRELSLALTGELSGDRIPKVIPLRVGQVGMPATLRDKRYLRVDPDRPEDVVQRLYQDLLSHHRDRGALSGSEGADAESPRGQAIPRDLPPTPPSHLSSSSAVVTGGTGPALRVRAELVDTMRGGDSIGAHELLRRERRLLSRLLMKRSVTRKPHIQDRRSRPSASRSLKRSSRRSSNAPRHTSPCCEVRQR